MGLCNSISLRPFRGRPDKHPYQGEVLLLADWAYPPPLRGDTASQLQAADYQQHHLPDDRGLQRARQHPDGHSTGGDTQAGKAVEDRLPRHSIQGGRACICRLYRLGHQEGRLRRNLPSDRRFARRYAPLAAALQGPRRQGQIPGEVRL